MEEAKLISNEGFKMIADNCPNLRLLNLFGCEITSKGLDLIATKCKNLEVIVLRYCKKLNTLYVLNSLQQKLPGVKITI